MTLDISMISEHKAAVGGIIAFLFGAAIRIFDRFSKKQSDDITLAQQLRKELREASLEAHHEVERMEAEVDKWREKYWVEVESHAKTRAELSALRYNGIVPQLSGSV